MTGSKPQLDGRTRCDDVDWDNPEWDDQDFGEYAYLCPDGNHKMFEYGARCIADIARTTDEIQRMRKPPSKVQAELEHLDKVLGKLSMEAEAQFNETVRPHDFFARFVELVRQLDEVPDTLSSDASVRNKAVHTLQLHERIQRANEAFGRLPADAIVRLEEVAKPRAFFNGGVERMRKLVCRAANDIESGRSKINHQRAELGSSAAAIWLAHNGSIGDKNFIAFIERLIENVGFGSDKGKPRVSLDTLVREIQANVAKHGSRTWQLFDP